MDKCVTSNHVQPSSSTLPPDAVAICGIGLRLPGGIETTEDLWDLLLNGRDARNVVVKGEERFSTEGFNESLGGKCSIRNQNGYFLQQDLSLFDPSFFSMSRREAERCDPQQRLLLEVTRECLEDAGEIDYRGRRIGCYVGSFGSTWSRLQGMDPLFAGNYDMTGTEDYMLSNRISYEYDLIGPSMTINTACSASLVALHEACLGLQNRSISGAVVGGACLQLSPHLSEMMATEGTLSKDGSSKSFDQDANGFARAEGITAVYLKRLDDAVAAGNPIRAVIRGSASGSDGNKIGLMQPQSSTQEALIRQLYNDVRLDPSDTAFVECHATGTAVGDPIEARAVDNVFGQYGVHVGSIKANIGHTEGSAGLASLIKAVLALENKIIPPNIKLDNPNPKIPLGDRLMVPLVPTKFPPHKAERISINSFGIGGANSHAIIEASPQASRFEACEISKHQITAVNGCGRIAINDDLDFNNVSKISHANLNSNLVRHKTKVSMRPCILLLSANTAYSLKRQAELHLDLIKRQPNSLLDIAYTRALHRERLVHRSFVVLSPDGCVLTRSDTVQVPKARSAKEVVMVFSGQGAQWAGMGRELLETVSEFKEDLNIMEQVLQALPNAPDWSLVDMLRNPETDTARFNTAEIAQPLCTALQIAILLHLRRLGVVPVAVVGHSSGEIAAAFAAGHISLPLAMKAAFFRGLVSIGASTQSRGGMAAIGQSAQQVSAWLPEGIVVACENSPSSTTISGDVELLEQALSSLKQENPSIFARRLNVNMAYHSHHMVEAGSRYLRLLETHESTEDDFYVEGGATFFSSCTGKDIDMKDLRKPEYWVRNLVDPVRFTTAVQTMHRVGGDAVILEIGPHSTLGGPLRQIYDAQSWQLSYVATQKRSEDCDVSMLTALGQLYQHGIGIDFSPLFTRAKAISSLPPYPWDHTGPSFWHESRVSRAYRFRKFPRHCLLGLRSLDSSDSQPAWRNRLEVEDLPWLSDHQVKGNIIFPFSGYVAIAGEATRQFASLPRGSGYRLRNIVVNKALVLKESQPVEIMTLMRSKRLTESEKSMWFEFQIQSYDGTTWTEHCSGDAIAQWTEHCSGDAIAQWTTNNYIDHNLKSGPLPLQRPVSSRGFYQSMACNGFHYGPEFALLDNITASATEQLAQASLIDRYGHCSAPFSFHPAELDNCLHLIFVAATQGLNRCLNQLYLPTRIAELTVHRAATDRMTVKAAVPAGDLNQCRIDCATANGEQILSLHGLQLTALDEDESIGQSANMHGLAHLTWHPSIDFENASRFLKAPSVNKEDCETEQELAYLYMLEEMSQIQNVTVFKEHFETLRAWMQHQVKIGGFPLIRDVAALNNLARDERQKLIVKYHARLTSGPRAPMAEACARVCQQGAKMFSGELDTVDVLLRDNLLTRVYDSISYDYSDFVRMLSRTKPNLRILEVGAGTGGTTDLILRDLVRGNDIGLPSYSLYTYTDISAGFFEKARDRFSYAPNMEFKVFDASRSPENQGFEKQKQSYDLVIAANVVHATPFIGETLANIRSLLRPGGALLLTELLPTLKTISYIFGHFSGWWLGDADERPAGPLIGVEEWDRRLRVSGFSGADTVAYDSDEPYRQIMTIVSFAQSPVSGLDNDQKIVNLVCQNESSDVAIALKRHLEQRGWTVQPHELRRGLLAPTGAVVSCVDLEAICISAELEEPTFEHLKNFLHNINTHRVLWLMLRVQTGAEQIRAAQFLGFARTLRSELGMSLYTLEASKEDAISCINLVIDVFEKIHDDADEGTLAPDMEYAMKDSRVLVPRYLPMTFQAEMERLSATLAPKTESTRALRIQKKGLLQTLYWQEAPLESCVPDGHVEIDIRAAGLNAYDILSAKGIINGDVSSESFKFGCEASGVIRRIGADVGNFNTGDRVMILTNGGCVATHVIAPSKLVFRIPDSMTFTEAATIPVCFGTVLYSLISVGRIERGQSVLIHSACGGVGLTAVQVCQMLGAEMYLTVGSSKKVKYLMDTFGIPRERIFSSRDNSFVEGIMAETRGQGVDFVLNSLSGELLHESWRCVARFGTMVELGLRDVKGSGRLDMFPFGENRSFVGVEAIQFVERPAILQKQFELFFDSAAKDLLGPIQPTTIFSAHDIERAFRFLEDASHIGKVVIEFPEPFDISSVQHIERVQFDPLASYLLTGGAGGLGRSIATWMVDRGARHLTFLSRRSGVSGSSQSLFSELESMGCSITAVSGAVDDLDSVHDAIRRSKYPIKGVFHLAMALHDAPLMEMGWSQWQSTVEPKAGGAWNLHTALLPQKLDFFLMASSLLSGLNTSGQANYVAGNAVMEALCQYRHNLNFPACVLNISAIEDVGFLADNEQAAQNIRLQDLMEVNERGFLECLELTILESLAGKTSLQSKDSSSEDPWSNPCQVFMGLQTTQDLEDPQCRTMWRRDRRMGLYHNRINSSTTIVAKGNQLQEFRNSLSGRECKEILMKQETQGFLATQIGKKINEYLLKPDEEVDPQSSLSQMGLDSLLSVELARWFKSALGVQLSVLEIMKHGNLDQLGAATRRRLLAVQGKTSGPPNGQL